MLGNILNKINNYYLKIGSFYGVILFIVFLCVFHKAYFSIVIIMPAVLLITNKYKNNKYFRETDLIVAVLAITFAFIMEFIISSFAEFNVLICIAIAVLITALITTFVAISSFFLSFISKPFFHYLKLD